MMLVHLNDESFGFLHGYHKDKDLRELCHCMTFDLPLFNFGLYYLALNKTQKTRKSENEDISSWLLFFLKIVNGQAEKSLDILKGETIEHLLSEKQLELWNWVLSLDKKEFSRRLKLFCKKRLKPFQVPIKVDFQDEVLHSHRFKKTRKFN